MTTVRSSVALIALALLLAVVPLSEDLVELVYADGLYPPLQALVTSASNLVPFAVFDALVVLVLAVWAWRSWRDVRRGPWRRAVGRTLVRTTTVAAGLYVAFLLVWGLNYRRVPLEAKLDLDYRAATPAAAARLADAAVEQLNRLHGRRVPDGEAINRSLPSAFAGTQARLGARRTIVPGVPKPTLFDAYFRAASVDGMTDPFFLETLLPDSLLPVERPMILAHEWAHLAGFADEGEANFVGWLACLSGDEAARYSAWLFMYFETAPALDAAARTALAARLDPGPRADLAAIARRAREQTVPFVSAIGWRLYDRYLKANGVAQGTRSYTDVVRLVLGTTLGREASGVGVVTGTSSSSPG